MEINELSNFSKPIWVSFILKDNQHLLSGESLLDAIEMLHNHNIDCMFINCTPIKRTFNALDTISNNWNKKWGIYPNLGIGDPSPDGIIQSIHPDDKFLKIIHKAKSLGVNVMGGCCGSNKNHIKIIKQNNS